MKNSNIQWIGEIPDDWEVRKVKNHFSHRKFIPGKRCDDYDRLALTLNGVILRDKNSSEGLQPKDFETYQLLQKGELVFKLIDLQNISTSRVGLAHNTGLVSPAYIIIHPNNIDVNYAEKYFLMMWHNEIFNSLGDEGVRSSLSSKDLLNLPIVVPPLSTQTAIAAYLDAKCSEIDGLIADINKQIEMLNELKKSTITEAVTKGLNKNAKLKGSGIQWIGMIPEGWRVTKIKFHLRRNEPRNPGNAEVLSVYREYGVVPKNSRDDNHNVTSEDTSKYKFVRKGDLVINKMKAWQGSLAVSDYEGIVSPAYFIYNFTDEVFHKKYFHHLIRSCYKDEFRRLSTGIREGQWDLPSNDFDNTLVVIPPLAEQHAIATYLDTKCTEFDSIISDKQKQISTLEAYKKSLIYEYVTGKKEVPNG